MKKRIMAIASALSLVIMMSRAQQLQAQSLPDREERYDVIQICNAGPCLPPPYDLVGQWFLACDGSFTGWGWAPDTYSTYTTITEGHFCDHGGPPEY